MWAVVNLILSNQGPSLHLYTVPTVRLSSQKSLNSPGKRYFYCFFGFLLFEYQ